MSALRIARAALLMSGIVYLTALALGALKIGNPLLLLAIAAYSTIGLGASAIVCVVLMILHFFRTHRAR